MTLYFSSFTSEKWLKFPNDFQTPDQRSFLWKRLGSRFSIPVGLSTFGMCGGLASTALDMFYSHHLPPIRTTSPSSRDDPALFNWLKQRQVDSINLKDFWKYLSLMFTNTRKDKAETAQAWRQIKQDILQDKPVLIGLQRAKVESWYKVHQLVSIVKNHQVVVWGAEEREDEIVLYIYDPNKTNMEEVRISFDLNSGKLNSSPPSLGPLYAIFKTSYQPKQIPAELQS